MEPLNCDKLRQRQKEIETTLEHLETERREIEANTHWISRGAYQIRVNLLEHLTT